MAINSRRKGKRGELEVVNLLKPYYPNARRGFQFRDGSDEPDVVGVPGIWIEVKRWKKEYPRLWEEAMKQACRARDLACERENIDDLWTAIVIARGDRRSWTVLLEDGGREQLKDILFRLKAIEDIVNKLREINEKAKREAVERDSQTETE